MWNVLFVVYDLETLVMMLSSTEQVKDGAISRLMTVIS